MARHLCGHFQHVELAHSAEEAETVLADPARSPTHLVCGQNLGPGAPTGSELIPRWRLAYPNIQCVVVATAQTDMPDHIDGVDALVFKPSSPSSLLALLSS